MKYTAISLAILSAALAFTSCKKDDKTESENITKVVIHLSSPGFDQEFEAKETNGDGIWDSIDEIILPSLTGDITCHVHVYDETQTPVADLTEEIEAESNAHIFTFKVTGADLQIRSNDMDAAGNPFNLETLWDAGDVSNGTVQIKLFHDPSDKNAVDPGGEVDFDLSFPVKIQ